MFLDQTNRRLQVVLTAVKTTTDMPVMASWEDSSGDVITKGLTISATNGTTAVDVVSSPDKGNDRTIKSMSVHNQDTAAKTLTLQMVDNGTAFPILDVTLQVGDTFGYMEGHGFYTQDTNGNRKLYSTVVNPTVTNPIPRFGFFPALVATSGTDTACTNGGRFWSSIYIPYACTLTGLSYLIGSVGGTNNVIVELHDNAGALVATSALAGAVVGTTATMQQVAFTTPYVITAPGIYYAAVQFNGATAKFRTVPAASFDLANTLVTGTVAGTFGTSAAITPGTTFTADVGPMIITY